MSSGNWFKAEDYSDDENMEDAPAPATVETGLAAGGSSSRSSNGGDEASNGGSGSCMGCNTRDTSGTLSFFRSVGMLLVMFFLNMEKDHSY